MKDIIHDSFRVRRHVQAANNISGADIADAREARTFVWAFLIRVVRNHARCDGTVA